MKVQVIEGDGWHEDKVGKVFGVYDEGDDVLLLEEDRGDFVQRYIYKDHCEEVSETETNQGDAVEQDYVNSPSHYQNAKFETIEVIEEITKGYNDGFVGMCVGNTQKYIARAPFKHASPLEDLRKAERYLRFAIDYLEAKEDGE